MLWSKKGLNNITSENVCDWRMLPHCVVYQNLWRLKHLIILVFFTRGVIRYGRYGVNVTVYAKTMFLEYLYFW
jgi:hypothetical protein